MSVIDLNVGEGATTINVSNDGWDSDTLVIGAGITQSEVIFESNNANGNVTIDLLNASGTMTGDSVTLLGDFQSHNAANSKVGVVTFANGSTVAINGALTNTWIGSATNTTLVGSNYDPNLFEVAPGGDNVTFGNAAWSPGNIAYTNTVDYNIGDGAVTITPNGIAQNYGTIVLGAGITAGNVIFESNNANGNVTIDLLNASGTMTDDSITMLGDFQSHNAAKSEIGAVTFANGSTVAINGALTNTWIGSATNTTLVGSNYDPNLFEVAPGGDSVTFGNAAWSPGNIAYTNTVDYNIGDGAVTITPNGIAQNYGSIVLGAGISASNVIYQANNANGNVTIDLLNASGTMTGDSITILGDFQSHNAADSEIGAVTFANGSTVAINGALTNTWIGSATNTTLVGSNYDPNLFELGPGGDSVTFGNAAWSPGNIAYTNTVDYNTGDGAATITPNGIAWDYGTIVMGAGITASEVIFQSNNANGNLTIDLLNAGGTLTGDSITIIGDLNYGGGFAARVDDIVVGAGSAASTIAITGNTTDTWIGSSTNTTLVGSGFSANLFELAAGGDRVTFGNGSQNGSKLNTVDYNKGDGSATVNVNGGYGTIVLGAGLTQNNVIFESDAAGDLTIAVVADGGTLTGDQLVVTNDTYNNWGQFPYDGNVVLQFSDGSTLTVNNNLTDTWFGSATDTNLVGSGNAGINIFDLGPGGDHVAFGNGSNGAGKLNIVNYGIGDGSATVNVNGGYGTIVLGAGLTQSDVIFESDSAGNLKIAVVGAGGTLTGDQLVITNDTYNNWGQFPYDGNVVLQFSDRSTLTVNNSLTDTWFGSATDTNLVGSGNAGTNIFDVGPGGDSVTFGSGSNGGGKLNIVNYGIGDGSATVDVNSSFGTYGTIVLGAGLTQSNVIFESDAAGDLTIAVVGAGGTLTSDQLVVTNGIVHDPWGTPYYNGSLIVDFSDGSTQTLSGSLTDTWLGSASTTLVGSGYAGENVFDLGAGGDSVAFGNGADHGGKLNIVNYGIGDGSATVDVNISAGTYGTIVLGAGITRNNVIFESDAVGDLTIAVVGAGGTLTSDQLVVTNYISHDPWGTPFYNGNLVLDFSDGSTQTLSGSLTDTWLGLTSTTLVGSGYAGENIFDLGPGGDSVTFGNGADHGGKLNIVNYGIGDGSATVNVNNGNGTIVLGAGITQNNVIFESDAAGDLTIAVVGAGGTLTGDQLVVTNYISHDPWGTPFYNGSLVLDFSDGSTLTVDGSLTDTWLGLKSTTLVGSGYAGENVFDLGAGGDSVTFGNGADHGGKLNIVNFGIGDGSATANVNNGNGTIVLGAGLTQSNIIFETDGAGDLTIAVVGAGGTLTGDKLVVTNDVSHDPWGTPFYNGNLVLDFSDGSTQTISGSLTDTWLGSASTILVGSGYAGENIFDLGPGGDSVTFGNGADHGGKLNIVNLGYGDGNATINTDGVPGTIQIAAGISANDVDVQLNPDGSAVISLLGGDGATGDNLYVDSFKNISSILVNNAPYSINNHLTILGTSGNDTLTAVASGDTIDGEGGSDYEIGSSGSNTFVYSLGYGDDYINAYSMGNSNSTIQMGPGITASDLTFSRTGGGSNWDLLIQVAGAGQIQVGMELQSRNISEIDFADGSTLSLMGNITFTAVPGANTVTAWKSGDTLDPGKGNVYETGTSGSNTFIYDLGYGNDYINAYTIGNSGSTIQMGAGITASDLTFSRTGGGSNLDLEIQVAGAGDIQIGNELATRNIQQIDFADGSTMSLLGALTFSGNGSVGTIVAYESGDTINPGVAATYEQGSSGSNTFIYDLGYGNDYINVSSTSSSGDRILMGAGITASDLTFNRAGSLGADLDINVAGAGYVQIDQELANRHVQEIQFADGSTMSLLGNLTFTGSAAIDDMTVWEAGDTLDGKGGNDIENGAGGADGFIFDPGYGKLEINETSGSRSISTAALLLGAGINPANIQVTADSSGDLILADAIAGDVITLTSMASSAAFGVGEAAFADGISLSQPQLLDIMHTESILGGATSVSYSSISNQVLDEPSNAPLNVEGSGNTISLATGGYLGIVSGGSNLVDANNGLIDAMSDVTSTSLIGSGDTALVGAGGKITISGSDDAVAMGNLGYAKILSGSEDTVDLSTGTLEFAPGLTAISLIGSNDLVTADAGGQLSLNGRNDAINLTGGSLSLSAASSVTLTGSSDVIAGGSAAQISLSGTNDDLTMEKGGYVGLVAGSGISVSMSGGTLQALGSVTNVALSGSNDLISDTFGSQFTVSGSGDQIAVGNNGSVQLLAGNKDSITLTNGSLSLSDGVTNTNLIGSDNIVDGGSGNQLNVSGTENILSFGTQSSINLAAGTDNIVAMSDGTVTLGTNGAALLVGSGNTLNMTAGGYTEIDGNNNVINAVTGDIVVLDAGDSGDTINMLGGTVVAASGVSNITIDGSLNDVVGPGAGSVTQGDPTFQEILSFFSANPDLPQTQITEAESGPSYQSELSSFIATANLPDFSPGLIAMLYGYSSLELSLLGINASVFSEAATIEQDFLWGTENAPVPTDNLTQVLQNLLPALIDTNPETQDMVTLALSELALSRIEEPGGLAVGLLGLPTPGSPVTPVPPQPNVDQIIISDTVAKLALEIAEQPDDAKTGNLVEKVHLPKKSDPYEIVVTPGRPAGDQVLVKNEHGTFFGQVLNDVDQYVAPIVDLLALATGQPELIIAASALSLVEAGQDFASGNDVGGIFSVIGAAGGGLGAFGKLGAFASSADDTLAEDIGQYLTDASNIGSGADGAVVAIDAGNILGGLSSGFSALAAIGGALEEFGAPGPLGVGDSTVSKFGSELANTASIAIGADQIAYAAETGSITSAINGLFEAAGGVAGLQNDTTAQKFALLGGDLASVAEASDEAANGQGNIATDIFAALTSLVQAQQQYSALGGLSGIEEDVADLWAGFIKSVLAQPPGSPIAVGSNVFASNGSQSPDFIRPYDPNSPGEPGYQYLYKGNQIVGISLLDLSDPYNKAIYDGLEIDINAGQFSGQYIVLGHGTPGLLTNTGETNLGTQPSITYSPESVADTLLLNSDTGYTPGQAVTIFGCDTAGASINPNAVINGIPAGQNFAQTLSQSLGGVPVTGSNTTIGIWSTGQYILNSDTSSDTNYDLQFLKQQDVIFPSTPGEIDASNPAVNNGSWVVFGDTAGYSQGLVQTDPYLQIFENYAFTNQPGQNHNAPLPVVNVP